jgi:non-heme chloroperoxidase
MKTLTWVIVSAFLVALVWLLTAQVLISVDLPTKLSSLRGDKRFDFAALAPAGMSGLPMTENYSARDRSLMGYRHYRAASGSHVKIYLLHSAGWQGMEFHALASSLANTAGADVYVPDLRGQGGSPMTRGDIQYEGQLVDDVADLIKATAEPGDIIIVGGHSEGGGLAARFAASPYGAKANGYIMLAPVISASFPASRPDLGGWAKPLSKRMFGLKMLNLVGLHWSDNETVVQYALPSSLRDGNMGYTVTADYSWRLYKGMRMVSADGSDFSSITRPFVIISGADDTVIIPDAYKGAVSAFTKSGEFQVVDGENHLSIVNSAKTLAIIQNWMAQLH